MLQHSRGHQVTVAHVRTTDAETGAPVIEHELPPRLDLRNHSPDGFAWGYGGSGPAQLALAILCWFGDEAEALVAYQDFKAQVIAPLHGDTGHQITGEQIHDWLQDWRERGGRGRVETAATEALRPEGDVDRHGVDRSADAEADRVDAAYEAHVQRELINGAGGDS